MLASECLTGGPHRIQIIGFRSIAACRAGGSVDLDDPFSTFKQMNGQPCTEAAGALDRPDPPARTVLGGESVELAEAEGIGGHGESFDEPHHLRR